MDPQSGSTDGQVGSPVPLPDAETQVASQTMLAEYAALRTEVDRRATVQWNVLALQLTSVGVIASLAISRAADNAIVSITNYMHSFELNAMLDFIQFILGVVSKAIPSIIRNRRTNQLDAIGVQLFWFYMAYR